MAQQEYCDEPLLPCSFKFYNFTAKISDVTIKYEVMKMENSLYLWIGDSEKMDDLSFALTTNFDGQSIATKIMGSAADPISTSIAKRLSMKLKIPVYVSFNVTANNIILPEIEKRIHEMFTKDANLFKT